MYKNISENKLMFPEVVSDELKDLLRKMLDKNPKKRIGIGNDFPSIVISAIFIFLSTKEKEPITIA